MDNGYSRIVTIKDVINFLESRADYLLKEKNTLLNEGFYVKADHANTAHEEILGVIKLIKNSNYSPTKKELKASYEGALDWFEYKEITRNPYDKESEKILFDCWESEFTRLQTLSNY